MYSFVAVYVIRLLKMSYNINKSRVRMNECFLVLAFPGHPRERHLTWVVVLGYYI